MRSTKLHWTRSSGWVAEGPISGRAALVIYFGDRDLLRSGMPFAQLRPLYPDAHLLGCSAGGQMDEDDVADDSVSALALEFATTAIRTATASVRDATESLSVGETIGAALAGPGLAAVFVLSDGLRVNGSALVDGIASRTGRVPISGGLAGDAGEFAETLVGCDAQPEPGEVAAVGFYGDDIRLGHGSAGGWDVFGPMRRITRSDGNVLLEVDGKPALDLYKLYLGPEDSRHLPGSALLFPIRVHDPKAPAEGVVRTILGVNEDTGSMTFAGDMPEGWSAQLMRGSVSRLCSGAAGAAEAAQLAARSAGLAESDDSAAIMVSCIGRRLLMGHRIDEEIEAANAALGDRCVPFGFYSFGEIAPDGKSGGPKLHNQTMTVTVLGEHHASASR